MSFHSFPGNKNIIGPRYFQVKIRPKPNNILESHYSWSIPKMRTGFLASEENSNKGDNIDTPK